MRNDLHSVETKWKAHVSFADFFLDCVGSWVFGGKVVLLTLVAQKYSHCLKQSVFTVAREEGQKLVRWARTATLGSIPSRLMVIEEFMCVEQPVGALCLARQFQALPMAYRWEISICWQFLFWGLANSARGTSSERRGCDWKAKGPALCESCSCTAHLLGSSQVTFGKMREAMTLVMAEYLSLVGSFV